MKCSFRCGMMLLALMAFGCKQRPEGSEAKALPGLGDYYVMHIEGNGRLVFYVADAKTHEPVKPLKEAFSQQIIKGSIGSAITIQGFPTPLANNGEVDYGWYSDQLWTCDDARRFVNQPAPAQPSQEKCLIELNTEDQYWYTVSIFNMDVNGQPVLNYKADPTLARLPKGKRLISDGPLRPGQDLNVVVDPKVVDKMVEWDKTYQNSRTQKTARNTCLKNGRAYQWLDLQAHFYCMLPYSPHRSCYSTKLVERAKALDAITDPQKKIGGLVKIYNDSFEECFGKNGQNPLPDEDAAVFKYIMFTKQGVMDFNVESENEIINKFYASKANPEPRPRRVVDAVPGWVGNQPRYDDVRLQQRSFMERLLVQAAQAAALKEAWWSAKAPTQAEIDALVAKGVNDDNNPYLDYRPTAAALPDDKRMSLPGKAILDAMNDSKDKFNLAGTHSCLQTGTAPTHWSDIQIHYFCVMAQPRYCYNFAVAASTDADTRMKAFKKCTTDTQYGDDGFAFVMKTQPEIFQYVMFGATHAFNMEQQQAIINKFWGVTNPADANDCNGKRPRRAEDPTDGTHCLPTKTYATPLQGIGN